MSLRIIGGTFRNRPIKSPKGDQTRPTSALLRKALFDICQSIIEGASFLDLFAGSGAIGIEALSRGASHATFVDKDRHALDCILKNLKELEIESKSTVIAGAVPMVFKRFKQPFDIVYIDPPYGKVEIGPILTFFDQSNLLNPGAHLFVETDNAFELPDLKHLVALEKRKYGNSFLHEFRKT